MVADEDGIVVIPQEVEAAVIRPSLGKKSTTKMRSGKRSVLE